MVTDAEKSMAATLAAFFVAHRAEIVAPLLAAYKPTTGKQAHHAPSVQPGAAQCACHACKSPAGGGLDLEVQQELDRLLLKLDITSFEDLPAQVQADLLKVAKSGALLGAEQLASDMSAEAYDSLVNLVNERAVALAADRSAAMVGMKWVDGELIPNPNTLWRIDEGTRALIRSDVSQALQEGWSNSSLADTLMDPKHAAFSEARANMVARTELAKMDMQANTAAWKESGLVQEKIWLLAQNPCDQCTANAEQGAIPIDDEFDGGEMEPPQHPNCSCDLAPVVGD